MAVATRRDGHMLRYKNLIFESNFHSWYLKIGPGKVFWPRNPKILLRKSVELVFPLNFDLPCGSTGVAGPWFTWNLWMKKMDNSWRNRWNLIWFSESTRIELSEYIYIYPWYFIPSCRKLRSKLANFSFFPKYEKEISSNVAQHKYNFVHNS